MKAVTSSSLQMLHINVQGHQLLCDLSRGGQRPLIPEVDKNQVFQAFHGLSHPWTLATRHVCTCHLAWHVFRHCYLVPRLPAMCQG
jgi:hypothetical protein